MSRYRKKPVVIKAVQLEDAGAALGIAMWMKENGFEDFEE